MTDQVPPRPNTPLDEALEVQERLMQFLLTQLARADAEPLKYLQTVRFGATEAMAKGAVQDGRRRRVADHMDWLLALAEITIRQKRG